jgi:threonine synthase
VPPAYDGLQKNDRVAVILGGSGGTFPPTPISDNIGEKKVFDAEVLRHPALSFKDFTARILITRMTTTSS